MGEHVMAILVQACAVKVDKTDIDIDAVSAILHGISAWHL